MAMLTSYPAATRVASGDIFILDGSGGTRKITAANAAVEFAGLISAVQHRSVYRGKSLGSSVTQAQKTAIQNGTFDDLYVGDYWTINGVNWRIADFDYFYNCGDTAFTKHHLVLVPDTSLYSAKMNEENITTGGYVLSQMYTTNLEEAKTKAKAAFSDMLQTHKDYLVNAVTEGRPSGGGWFDSELELMNEIMVYGCHVFTPASTGTVTPTRYTTGNSQFALFQLNPRMIKTRYTYWLRDVVTASAFAIVNYDGGADYYNASNSLGVRPYIVIG